MNKHMNQKKGFADPVTIGIVAFVVVVVIMFGYYFAPKKDSAVSDVIQNESDGTQVAKQCSSDKDCAGINSYCAWGICKQGNDVSSNNTNESMRQATSTNLFPANKAVLLSEDASKAITFRWTPIVPKPQEPVTYRLRVWQLMQGQNSTEAMRTNQPIVTKDVDNITEASVSGIYTGPCRPPYLCDYVWNVEVSVGASANREAVRPSFSEISTFSIKEPPTADGSTGI